jgi:antitoxin VapB
MKTSVSRKCLIWYTGTIIRYNGVGMGMNIKNDETHRLVQELASLTGESQTAAITEAVRERLDRIRSERGGGLAERMVAIGKDCAAHLKEPFRSTEHGDLLYGEDGLPK